MAKAVEAGGPQSTFSMGPSYAARAVIVNPSSPDAGAGAALGAALRYPVLFASSGSMPAATTDALTSLSIHSTLVVGSPSEIGDAVVSRLPSAQRLGDSTATSTATAVARQSVAQGLPDNVVYVTNQGSPMDGALVGAAAARLGGLVLVNAGGSASAAANTLAQLHLNTQVDRLVVARSPTAGSSSVPWVLIGIFVALGVIGIVLLFFQGVGRRKKRETRVVA